jgi:hypothetical protein
VSLSRLVLFIGIAHYHLIPLAHIIVPVTFISSGLIHLRAVSGAPELYWLVNVLSVNNNSSIFLDNTAAHGSFSRRNLISCAVELIIKRLILFTHKVALRGRKLVRSLPHFAEIGSLIMKSEELPQLSILLLLEPIIGCVELGLPCHNVTTIDIVVSSLLVLLQNVCFGKRCEGIVNRSLFLPELGHVGPEI